MVRLSCAVLLATLGVAAHARTVQNGAVDELSGLAVSHADPAVLWGHNDTGDGPNLYRFGLQGEDYGAVNVKGAQAGDWEDIAAFDDESGPALLVADTGDNFSLRAYSTLYAVRDPGRAGPASLLWRLDFQYPDGTHDCEAVAVDPLSREIILVTKREEPARVYKLPLPKQPPRERATAELVGTVAPLGEATVGEQLKSPLMARFFHMPTGMDISRDGLTAVIVTLRDAYVYRRKPGQSWIELFQRPANPIRLPALEQTEAVALTPDGKGIYIGSEGRPGIFEFVDFGHAGP